MLLIVRYCESAMRVKLAEFPAVSSKVPFGRTRQKSAFEPRQEMVKEDICESTGTLKERDVARVPETWRTISPP